MPDARIKFPRLQRNSKEVMLIPLFVVIEFADW
jgi:hypothetical protein